VIFANDSFEAFKIASQDTAFENDTLSLLLEMRIPPRFDESKYVLPEDLVKKIGPPAEQWMTYDLLMNPIEVGGTDFTVVTATKRFPVLRAILGKRSLVFEVKIPSECPRFSERS
jgi:hypothetical protein